VSESWYDMCIVNKVWLEEVLLKARMEDGKAYLEYVLDGCSEEEVLPYDLAKEAIDKGMYDSNDLLGMLLERSCGKGESIEDVAISILQEDIAEAIKKDLAGYRYMINILNRVWLFKESNLALYEIDDIEDYMEENGIVRDNADNYENAEFMYIYVVGNERHKESKYYTDKLSIVLLKEEIVQF